ncbi:MAG: hypothetical protein ACPG77_16080, partial [Nannocystaceae bacterium]
RAWSEPVDAVVAVSVSVSVSVAVVTVGSAVVGEAVEDAVSPVLGSPIAGHPHEQVTTRI